MFKLKDYEDKGSQFTLLFVSKLRKSFEF